MSQILLWLRHPCHKYCMAIKHNSVKRKVPLVTKTKRMKLARSQWQLYLFLLLPIIYLILFKYVPMVGIQIAFKNFNARDGIWGSPWVGLKQFQNFFASYTFERVIGNTLRLSLYSILVGFPIPILFALILNSISQRKFKKTVQTVTYMPHFISVVVLVGIVLQILNPRIGLYGTLYSLLNNGASPPDPMGSATAFPHIYIWSGIWQNFGWGSIIYIAALSGVDMQLHEAAQIDGASRFQRVIHIDFPSILPTATIMLIMRTGHIMSIGFEKIYLMQNNLNLATSEIISTYVYKVGLSAGGNMNFSYSTAIDLFNSVVNLILIILVNYLAGKMSETSLW